MWSDILTKPEAEYTMHAIGVLGTLPWAQSLLRRVHAAGGITSANKPLLFEVRFALELHRAGVIPDYEYPAGVGDSTVDFRVPGSVEWLIEVVSIGASNAVKRATHQRGLIYEQLLSTGASDPAQSGEGEMITAEQKIGEKVFASDGPTKFPIPTAARHLILTDMRGYLDQGGNVHHYLQIAYGHRGIPPDHAWTTLFWPTQSGTLEPIKGLFEKTNPLTAAPLIQGRIHFLGFVCEQKYEVGEIQRSAYYFANPKLFADHAGARRALASYPLDPIRWNAA